MARNDPDLILDQCVSALQDGSRTVEDCLALYPERRQELEPLLRLALRLQAARFLQAPPGFRAAAGLRLQKLALSQPQARRDASNRRGFLNGSRSNHRLGRSRPAAQVTPAARLRSILRIVLLVLALLVATGAGTTLAAAQAIPGDMLYPVKRARESVQLTLSQDEANDARLHLAFADERLEEAAALLQQNRPTQLDQALAGYNENIQAELAIFNPGTRLSPAQQSDLAGQLMADAARHETRLEAILAQAPPSLLSSLEAALTVSRQARSQAAEIINRQPDPPGGATGAGSPAAQTLTPSPTASPTSALAPQASPTPLPPTKVQATRPPSTGLQPAPTQTPSTGLQPAPTQTLTQGFPTKITPLPGSTLAPSPTLTRAVALTRVVTPTIKPTMPAGTAPPSWGTAPTSSPTATPGLPPSFQAKPSLSPTPPPNIGVSPGPKLRR